MTGDLDSVGGAFSEPVFGAQSTFRRIMDAMARPGTVQALRELLAPPGPLSSSAGAIALTLCDHDTPVWLDTALTVSEAVGSWLAFHTGAPIVRTPSEAHFVFCSNPAELIALENFAQGSQEYPDRSATIIIQVAGFETGDALQLAGPGILDQVEIAPAPLPRHFAEQWKQNRARFPRGVDVIFAGPDAVCGLPRSTRINQPNGG
ncbi:MAG: phosphonate C-P lyase system protein PhnH [Rhizobiaceae bacterium]|nr:phosphonate C-P lyase system protein PhnH [Rhizobiaceae bacterium]